MTKQVLSEQALSGAVEAGAKTKLPPPPPKNSAEENVGAEDEAVGVVAAKPTVRSNPRLRRRRKPLF